MKIGIDMDNVITNFNDELLNAYLKHDKEIRNTGIINSNPDFITCGMFDWTEEENDRFYHQNIEEIVRNLKPIKDAKKIIEKLKRDGHEIYIITARDIDDYSNPEKLTIDWLAKYRIPYDKLLTRKKEKAIVCLENQIDIMIDDSTSLGLKLQEKKVRYLRMQTRYNQDKGQELETVKEWEEIFQKIKEKEIFNLKETEQEKIHVILDTDTYNEVDDQFAVAYLLQSEDKVMIDGITIAPFHHDNSISIQEGTQKSYEEVLKIGNFLGKDLRDKTYKGSTDYYTNGYRERNEAVSQIIQIAKQNEKTTIVSIGAITNIAIAITLEPEIIERINIIWLGGHSPLNQSNESEFNFSQDVEAVKEVFQSKVNLTIIPVRNVAKNLMTSIYELKEELKKPLGQYLCQHFLNDGFHGNTPRRVIWDISAVAYLLHPEWSEVRTYPCPDIDENLVYHFDTSRHNIKFVTDINPNLIYKELFQKLKGEE